jgi:hypothetical protein
MDIYECKNCNGYGRVKKDMRSEETTIKEPVYGWYLCKVCWGTGYLDWISNIIRGNKNESF